MIWGISFRSTVGIKVGADLIETLSQFPTENKPEKRFKMSSADN